MNELVYHAKMCLVEDDLSLFDVAMRLNEIPFASLDYRTPSEAFTALISPQ